MNEKTIILAAGSSSRLGEKKQLLTYGGDTLLNRTIELCQNAHLGEVYVVLGHEATTIGKSIHAGGIHIIINSDWALGMGTSLAKGIQALPDSSTGVFILLTDQIKLSSEILLSLQEEAREYPDSIICCRYQDNYGAPTYIPASHFDALRKLEGATGAKKYIQKHLDEVKFIEFPGGELDIDYPADLDLLKE